MTISDEAYGKSSKELKCEVAVIRAVVAVESNSKAFAENGFPIILFEPHIFSRLTSHRYDRSHPTISSKSWNHDLYERTQSGRQEQLELASTLDRDAALQSCSYGAFQIMGFNHKACGCLTVQDFVNKMCKSEDSQLDLFVSFILSKRLEKELRHKNWAAFAFRYNGPSYKTNRYDEKLAEAYKKFATV